MFFFRLRAPTLLFGVQKGGKAATLRLAIGIGVERTQSAAEGFVSGGKSYLAFLGGPARNKTQF